MLMLNYTDGFSFQKNPHGSLKIPCASCHTPSGWKIMKSPMEFNHDSETKFQLLGTHRSVSCLSCHSKLDFKNTPSTCQSCHTDVHKGTLSVNCESCHQVTSWSPLPQTKIMDIHNSGRFPLVGAHQNADCFGCHAKSGNGAVFRVTKSLDCISCHRSDYAIPKSPDHVLLGFPNNCLDCHSPFSWKPAAFNHDVFSFPLTGAHKTLSCESCHAGNRFKGTPNTCIGCHQQDFSKTINPNHIAAGFSTDCQTCHSTSTWTGASFNHNLTTFPLTGNHLSVSCESCHKNNVFKGLPQTCYACHQLNFEQSVNPNHITAGFSTTCQSCHSTFSWQPASFDHNTTAFPLTGRHVSVSCSSCHKNDVFKGLAATCYACHQTDFNSVTSPNHITGSFSKECQACHTTTGWKPASFDHNLTTFPLTGAHKTTSCESCHVNGVFKGTSKTCYPCHQTDFTKVTSPNHVTGKFPVTCETCHTTLAWKPSTFNHDGLYFPIYSGEHRGKWSSCTTCHEQSGNYKSFTCMSSGCHSKNSTDGDHRGISGYSYTAAACYSCHPKGDD